MKCIDEQPQECVHALDERWLGNQHAGARESLKHPSINVHSHKHAKSAPYSSELLYAGWTQERNTSANCNPCAVGYDTDRDQQHRSSALARVQAAAGAHHVCVGRLSTPADLLTKVATFTQLLLHSLMSRPGMVCGVELQLQALTRAEQWHNLSEPIGPPAYSL